MKGESTAGWVELGAIPTVRQTPAPLGHSAGHGLCGLWARNPARRQSGEPRVAQRYHGARESVAARRPCRRVEPWRPFPVDPRHPGHRCRSPPARGADDRPGRLVVGASAGRENRRHARESDPDSRLRDAGAQGFEGWFGAVLTATPLLGHPAVSREQAVLSFLRSAVVASRDLIQSAWKTQPQL